MYAVTHVQLFAQCPIVNLIDVSIKCKGDLMGSITTNVSSGISPYTYSWSNFATIQNLTGLGSGIYVLTVTDNNGCSSTSSATVTEPATALTLQTPSATSTGCGTPTGTATASASGGTGTLTYLWNPGNKLGTTITGLIVGNYTVTVADANACTVTGTAYVSSSGGQLIYEISQKNVKCNGDINGNIYAMSPGDCVYTWSTGASGNDGFPDLINVGAGTYTLSVTNTISSCTQIKTFTITEPPPIVITTTISNATNCNTNGASVIANVSGGTGAYIYSWSDGSSGIAANNLGCSTYTLSVTDANGCIVTTAVVVSDVIGINELNNEIDFSIYPNPARTAVTIETTINQPYLIQFTNLLGEIVFTSVGSISNTTTINVGTLPKGIYIVQIINTENNTIGRQRLVMQ